MTDRSLDALGDIGGGVQIVPGRWDDDPQYEIAVALGQILQLRQKQPSRRRGDQGHAAHDGERHQTARHDPPLKADDRAYEDLRKAVDARQAHAGDGSLFAAFGAESEQPVGEGRNDGDRNDQRQEDRHRDRHRDIAEELTDLQFHDEHGNEDHHRRQGGNQHGTPDLRCALEGRLGGAQAAFAQAIDVLQHHDGGIHHHPDGEGQPRQGNHIDRTAQGRHGDEGADDRNRNGQ